MAADRVEKLFKKQAFQYEIRDCERDFESKDSLPLEPDQHGYREGVLRIGDIQRAIISVYDFTYISDAESMGLGIFFAL